MSRRRPYKRGPVAPAVIIRSEPEWMPTFSLNRHIAETRQRVGEARWAELMAEWN